MLIQQDFAEVIAGHVEEGKDKVNVCEKCATILIYWKGKGGSFRVFSKIACLSFW
jgi:hypothetical protein